ncbi:hypothetical protein HY745_12945 [Candidatus Desantisbacteria bacterium]|nr:hypothetical protein [Candidatus Desantisbacteria bacterium]
MTKFTKGMIINDILDRCPGSYAVLIKYFGPDYLLSSELKKESIDANAEIYGVDANKIVKEINMLIH